VSKVRISWPKDFPAKRLRSLWEDGGETGELRTYIADSDNPITAELRALLVEVLVDREKLTRRKPKKAMPNYGTYLLMHMDMYRKLFTSPKEYAEYCSTPTDNVPESDCQAMAEMLLIDIGYCRSNAPSFPNTKGEITRAVNLATQRYYGLSPKQLRTILETK